MTPRFWRLQQPEYESDYQSTYVNGDFDRNHAMPGIRCETCGATWASSHVMPYACPVAMQAHPNLIDPRPIAADLHRSLRRQVLAALHADGQAHSVEEDAIRGAFMGGDLRVPSVPRADFLWAGLGSLLVSSRVRATLLDAASGAIATTPARLTRVGRAEVAPEIGGDVPDSLLEQHGIEEPEDLVTKLAVHKPSVGIGPYFEVVVCRESERPRGAEVISRCSDCGREEFDRAKRELVLHPGMWRGDQIFLLATTLWVVVTEELRVALLNTAATNVRFVPIPSAA